MISTAKAKTQSELAQAVGRSLVVVREHIKRPGFPPGPPWDVPDCIAYFASVAQPGRVRAPDDDEVRESTRVLAVAKAELTREQARKEKLANDEREGLLWDAAAVRQLWAMALARLKDRMESLPDEITMEIPQDVRVPVTKRIADKLNLALVELANAPIDPKE